MSNDACAPLKEEQWYMLADDLEDGEYAFFVASGLSKEAGLPTGGELAVRIIEKLYRNDPTAIEKFKRSFSYDGPLELPTVTQLIDNEYHRDRLINKLLIKCVNWKVAPAYVHGCISLLAIRISQKGKALRIITPNYDTLLEDSLPGNKDVIVLHEHHENPHDAWPWVLKIHGCINTQPMQTIRITAADLSQPLEPWKETAIRQCLYRRGLIVIGYGATDIHVSQLINKAIREANKPSYWISLGPPPEEAVKSLAEQYGRYVPMDATSFFRNTGII